MKIKLTVIVTIFVLILAVTLPVLADADQKSEDKADKNADQVFSPEIVLPDSIPAVVGKEVNIYFENVINDNPLKYQIDVVCSIGNQQNERWTCVPEKEGVYPLSINIYKDYSIAAKAYTEVIVKPETNHPDKEIKCLFIGDSITSGGIYTKELLSMAGNANMKISLIGTKGALPNCYEGISSKTVDYFFINPESPFVFNGVFNFSRYMKKYSFTSTDYVFINLGINDLIYVSNDEALEERIASMLMDYQCMINSIKSFNEEIKVGIMITIPPSSSQDAFGRTYGSGQTQWRYKRNNFIWTKELIEKFRGSENKGIYLVPANVNLDTRNNMLMETVAVNSRNPATVERQRDGVHPATSGYMQIADMVYYFLKGNI